MMIHEQYVEVEHARAGDLADIAAMDRLARDLAPASSLRRYARELSYGGAWSSLSRWSRRRRHVSHAR
jgi:hypothetical protein